MHTVGPFPGVLWRAVDLFDEVWRGLVYRVDHGPTYYVYRQVLGVD